MDESGSIDLVNQIASFSYHRCRELARKLLSNDRTMNFHSYSKNLSDHEHKKQFVSEMFARWLEPDVVVYSAKPCTWDTLAKCLEKLDGLGRSLAKDIRENCHNGQGVL